MYRSSETEIYRFSKQKHREPEKQKYRDPEKQKSGEKGGDIYQINLRSNCEHEPHLAPY